MSNNIKDSLFFIRTTSKRVERAISCNRWFVFFFGLVLSIVSGTVYLFPTLAPRLKDSMGYEQYQISTIATMGNIGTYIGVLPNPWIGVRLSSLYAALMLFGGYFGLYASVMRWIKTNYIVVGLFYMMLGNGSVTSYMVALQANISNFSQASRGKVLGLLAAMFGLSSAVFGFIFQLGFQKHFNLFFLVVSIITGAISLGGTFFMSAYKDDAKEESEDTVANESTPFIVQEELSLNLETRGRNVSLLSKEKEIFKEASPLRVVISIDFWLLFVIIFAGLGSGLNILINLGEVVRSYGGKMGSQDLMVIVFSISNCLGRILAGFLSDALANYTTRVTILNFSVLTMGFASYCFAFAPLKLFYPLVIIAALAYGVQWCLAPAYLTERFGNKYFPLNFSLFCLAPTCGSYLLATLMASKIYEAHSREGSNYCFGRSCWQLTFFINCLVCVIAFGVGMILMYRARKMYSRINAYNQEKKEQDSHLAATKNNI